MGSQHRFRFGAIASQAPSGEEWASLARRVEELGYSTLLLPDTLGRTLPPIPALAAAAAATTSLRVGTYVLANDFHHPVQVARDAAAIDFLSGGRFELGIGAGRDSGGEEYRILGLPFESGGSRVRRLEESLGILRGLFAGETVSFSGRHYQVEGAEVFPAPVQQPGPPILVAGRGRRMLSLAARFADVVALGLPPE